MTKVSKAIEELVPYQPGKSIEELQRETGQKEIIKLASNENALGPSPKAIKALQTALGQVHRYPDGGFELKNKIAERFGRKPENVILGNGSDSLMLAIVLAFVTEGGEVVTSEYSFAQYTLMPLARGATVRYAPMKNWHYDLKAIANFITEKTQAIFLSNPNNPTGTMFTKKEWDDFLKRTPKEILIVCDEAYAEFVEGHPEWPNSLDDQLDNVITLRTFSKAYGLAGLRLGYGFGSPHWIRELHKVKLPFEPSVLAQVAGLAALDDQNFVRETIAIVACERQVVQKRLTKMGLKFIPSVVNFVMVNFENPQKAKEVNEALLKKGVIIRPLNASGLLSCARITIGLPQENQKWLDAIEEVLCGKS